MLHYKEWPFAVIVECVHVSEMQLYRSQCSHLKLYPNLHLLLMQGQPAPGPFNEEEDCMVPSTPTLFVPKRTDGFAEAIR